MNVLFFLFLGCGEQKSNETDSATDSSSEDQSNVETQTGGENNEEENNEEENNEEENNEENISCSERSLEDCDSYEGCETLSGYPIIIVNETECVDNSTQEIKACVETGCSAEPTITVAHPPDSQECWLFASGCLPEGWERCSTYPQDCQ